MNARPSGREQRAEQRQLADARHERDDDVEQDVDDRVFDARVEVLPERRRHEAYERHRVRDDDRDVHQHLDVRLDEVRRQIGNVAVCKA